MKYLYKKTGAVVESGIRLNPAIFQPVAEEKKETGITEQKEADVSAETVEATSAEKIPAKTSAVQKKTTVRRTTSAKK